MVEGKAVVVTGAGRGIGRAYAEALGAAGALVLVNNRTGSLAEEVAAGIVAQGGKAVADGNDISTSEGARAVVDHCVHEFGKIDVLINNAGVAYSHPAWRTSDEEVEATMRSHLFGTWWCGQQAMDHMREQRSGAIINSASGAIFGTPGFSAYAAAKGGIVSMSYTWALELAPYGITVNCISPRALTRGSPKGIDPEWFGTPEHNAPLIVYLASDDAKWVSGQVIGVSKNRIYLVDHDGGPSMVRDEGWTPEKIRDAFPEALGPFLRPCAAPDTRRKGGYPWYGGVGADGDTPPAR